MPLPPDPEPGAGVLLAGFGEAQQDCRECGTARREAGGQLSDGLSMFAACVAAAPQPIRADRSLVETPGQC